MEKETERVVDYLRRAQNETIKVQLRIARIPCPDYRADERAGFFIKALRSAGLRPRRDRVGNVIAKIRGTDKSRRPTLVLCAHLDSVFSGLTDIRVRRKDGVYHAAGISDDAAGVANLIILAHALKCSGVKPQGDVVLVGSVGEESGGAVWGMEHFWKANRFREPWFVAVDGGEPGRIVRKGLASWTPTITVEGPGGHSYSGFGRPNPIHVLSRIVARLTAIKADASKDAIYNANMISGGTAPNAIPEKASVTINLRSSDPGELARMRRLVERSVDEARREELGWATSHRKLKVSVTAKGRPGGCTDIEHPLVRAAVKALEAERLKVSFKAASTDANLPLSLGIPSITISSGGHAENLHSLDEWHDMRGRTRELAALGRILLSAAGQGTPPPPLRAYPNNHRGSDAPERRVPTGRDSRGLFG